jgi:hypothetical protein
MGRWRGASTGADRRAQLDQISHVGDRHGLVVIAESAPWSCAPSSVAPDWARSAARRPAESGAAGRCAGPAGDGANVTGPRAAAAARLDPIEPSSATMLLDVGLMVDADIDRME